MNVWEYLGIEATQDERLIKRAYATLLKQYSPEKDPDEFIILRSAYEFALKSARDRSCPEVQQNEKAEFSNENEALEKYGSHSEKIEVEEIPVVSDVYEETHFNYRFNLENHLSDLKNGKSEQEMAQIIFEETKKLLQNDVNKLIKSNWLVIFQHPDLWNLQVKEIYIELLFDLFSKQKMQIILPNKIWLLINQFCLWRERELELYKIYAADRVDSVLHLIRVALKEKTTLKMKKAGSMRRFSKNIVLPGGFTSYSTGDENNQSQKNAESNISFIIKIFIFAMLFKYVKGVILDLLELIP